MERDNRLGDEAHPGCVVDSGKNNCIGMEDGMERDDRRARFDISGIDGGESGTTREANSNRNALPERWRQTIAVIWSGQAASTLATVAASFAALWYITVNTDSAFMLSLAGMATLLPTAVLSPFGGVVADRFNKKRVMILADGIAGAFSLVLAFVVLAGSANIPLIVLLLVARSTAQAFHGTALMALMPELVPERDMVRINTLDQMLTSGSAIIGPVIGIALYTAWGFAAVLLLDAACAAFACACLAAAKLPYAKVARATSVFTAEATALAEGNAGVFAELKEGFAVIFHDRSVLILLAMVMFVMLLFLPLGTLTPLMTYDWFGGNGFQASLAEAAASIGLLVGSVAMLVWGGGKKLVPILVSAGALIGLGCVVCGLLPSSAFPVYAVLIGVIFAATAAFSAPVIPLMQKRVPQEKFGRVMGLYGSLTALAAPVGLAIAGPAVETWGISRWFVVCGVVLVVVMVMELAFAGGKLKSLDD